MALHLCKAVFIDDSTWTDTLFHTVFCRDRLIYIVSINRCVSLTHADFVRSVEPWLTATDVRPTGVHAGRIFVTVVRSFFTFITACKRKGKINSSPTCSLKQGMVEFLRWNYIPVLCL